VFEHLFETLEPGLLSEQLSALKNKIKRLAQDTRMGMEKAPSRIRILGMAARPAGAWFHAAASATLQRRKLHIHFHNRERNDITERTVSPQRIVHYRDNWYLDAWCELRKGLRSFSISQIKHAIEKDAKARDVAERKLDKHYASSYGIFAGEADKLAVLRFSAERARWVADEQWHPRQKHEFLPDGRYELRIPYQDERELVMDVLRHSGHVEVAAPASLRDAVVARLRQEPDLYGE